MNSPKLKNSKDNSKCPPDEKDVTQIGERAGEGPSHSNKAAARNASTASLIDSPTCIEDSKRFGDRKDDPFQSEHQREAIETVSSHDILLDPGLIPRARLARRAEKSDADYPSQKDTSGNAGDSEIIDLSQRGPDREDDLRVAEDRRRFQYPYWYRGQPANQRYRINDRRDRYRNYLRYPVFPGR